MINLFDVDNMDLKLRVEELILYPEFNLLFAESYNKGFKGDESGKEKLRAYRECLYIHNTCRPTSPLAAYTDDEKHGKGLELAQLPEDYIVSPELKNAIGRYNKELRAAKPEVKALDAATKALHKFTDLCIDISETLDIQSAESVKEKADMLKLINDASKSMANVRQLIRDIKEAKKDVEKAMETTTVYGDKETSEWETSIQ